MENSTPRFFSVAVPAGNGYRDNPQGILRIAQHMKEKPQWGMEVVTKDGLPVLGPDGIFYLKALSEAAKVGMVELVLANNYGTVSYFVPATAEDLKLIQA